MSSTSQLFLFFLLQAGDGLRLPYALVGVIVALSLAILGLASRQGAQGQKLTEACNKLKEIDDAAQKEGSMSAASRERFASIETLVRIHADELSEMRKIVANHHERTDIHVTKEWREDFIKRFDRVEQLLIIAVSPARQHDQTTSASK